MSVKYVVHEAHDLDHRVHFILSRDPYVGGQGIGYKVIDDDVVLTGSVRTYYQKQMAQESLRKVAGIRRIINDLNVLIK